MADNEAKYSVRLDFMEAWEALNAVVERRHRIALRRRATDDAYLQGCDDAVLRRLDAAETALRASLGIDRDDQPIAWAPGEYVEAYGR